MNNVTGSCQCGLSKFNLSRLPTQRLKCHCTICQSVYDGPCSDFLLADAKTVHLVAGHKIEFGQHKKPPALDRGVCTDCQRPVMGFMGLIPGVKLAFIPRYALGETDGLPPVSKHIWYQSRIADVDDDVVKVEGKLHSNMACLGPFYKGYRGK